MDYLTALFCQIDDFCQEFEPRFNSSLIESRKTRRRKSCINTTEIMTVWIYFHHLRMLDFKSYYLWQIKTMLRREFPNMPGYNRFVELTQRALPAMLVFLKTQMGQCTDVGVVDSTSLAVCHNRCIHSHKVFKDIAKRGKTSMGWFYSFKLHAVFNRLGELVTFRLSAGNTDDRHALKQMAKQLSGTLVGDKGYISKDLADWLKREYGITLLTGVKKGMKAPKHTPEQKRLLRQRSVVETIFDQLKNLCQIEHSRHCSEQGFLLNLISGLAAYCLFPYKPMMFGKKSLLPNK